MVNAKMNQAAYSPSTARQLKCFFADFRLINLVV